MKRCHIAVARWVKAFRGSRDSALDYLRKGRLHVENNTVQLLASLLDADRRWTARELAAEVGVRHKKSAPHSARHSGLPQTCSALDTTWKFWGATMAPLCNGKVLVGPVSKGRWLLSWANCRCGRNLGSLIRTRLESPIKAMEVSRFSSSEESTPCTVCSEVMFIVPYDIVGVILHQSVPPRLTVNAVYYCTFLKHHLLSALRWTQRHGGIEPLAPLAMGDSETSTYSPHMSPCDHDLFAEGKEPLRGSRYNTRDELIRAVGRSNTEHQQRWTRWWCTTPSKHLKKGDK